MFAIEKAFMELLKPTTDIPIVVKYTPLDYTPCITIQQVDETFQRREYVEIHNEQYIRKKYSSDIWINLWCNNEKERHLLIELIQNRIFQAEANHYTTCNHYNFEDERCSVLESKCEALTRNTNRTNKEQCPHLDIYQSFFKTNHIIKNSFHINSITNLDELDIAEPILRTIFKINLDYYQYCHIGGRVFENIRLKEELL